MVEVLPTAVAILAAALVGIALITMSAGNYMAAGMSFMSASLVIFLRETRLKDDE